MRPMAQPLAAHEEMLLACVTTSFEKACFNKIDTLLSAPDLEWPALVRSALEQGVAQFVAHQLHCFSGDLRLPSDVAVCLDRIYRATTHRNQVMFLAAAHLVQAMEQAAIPCLVLKGVALAPSVYPDPTLRHFADIDILVDPARLAEAITVAEDCGFSPKEREIAPKDYHIECTAHTSEDILAGTLAPEFVPLHSADFLREAGHRIPLEIHCRLFNLAGGYARPVDMAPFWENPQDVTLPDGTKMHTPSPEAMLVHLASHAGRHRYGRLLFPVDIAYLIRTYGQQIDWDRVRDLTVRYKVRKDLYRILMFVHQALHTDVPQTFLRWLESDKHVEPVGPPLAFIDMLSTMRLMQQEPSAMTCLRFLHGQNMRECLVSGWHILFPAPATMRRYYQVQSPLLLAVCYVWRPFLLIGRAVRVASRLWRSRARHRLVPVTPAPHANSQEAAIQYQQSTREAAVHTLPALEDGNGLPPSLSSFPQRGDSTV